ncbi:MAG TPA: ATP-binding cassette domain-containing protein [Candidatus Nanopelagicales bacterium]|nr:ATP-binding cassette domain-containing protein [Candidatus Nanopelagicales bacterium]
MTTVETGAPSRRATAGDGDGLELDGISKRYGEVVALDELSLQLRPGEVFGFVGSNGAGKTTAMRIALGVLLADAGEVRWAGRPVTAQTRRRIGYMPEERGLYPRMRVGEQLVYLARLHGLAPDVAQDRMLAWTERLGVASRRGDDVQKLSLGNQQRVQLAAALVHDPAVLVLDEPFSGLDPVAVDVMSGVLAEQAAAGVPVLFSSHQLDLVERVCDRVGIINAGRLVAGGTVEQLRGTGPEQVVVDLPGAPAGWYAGLPGVVAVETVGSRVVLRLPPGADDQPVLQAALATGHPVREFARRRPSLTELYRDVVSAPEDATDEREQP